MDTKQTAAYLAGKTKDSFEKIMYSTDIPRHYVTERGILFNRVEVDAWLMKRTSPPPGEPARGGTGVRGCAP